MSYNHFVLMTIDVEDWFQVENFRQWIPHSSWSTKELRVEKSTHRLLDLLDSVALEPPAAHSGPEGGSSPKATFFVLGWIARRLPGLVCEIHSRGHEVASHGYYHNLCNKMSPQQLKADLYDSKKCLEDITGAPIFGYRAPSFSISQRILKPIAECGYLYDSSFNSFGMHGRYGCLDLSQYRKKGIAVRISDTFCEIPISNINLGTHALPWGGGAYFRLIPFSLFKTGVQSILRREGAYVFYMHPWEVDGEQPKISEAPKLSRFKHYTNVEKTAYKLSMLMTALKTCHFITCFEYLQAHESLA